MFGGKVSTPDCDIILYLGSKKVPVNRKVIVPAVEELGIGTCTSLSLAVTPLFAV